MPDLTFDTYQARAATTAKYPGLGIVGTAAINYTVLGLAGEVGELTNKWKKVFRDAGGTITPEMRAALLDELGDVLWYAAVLAAELGATFGAVGEHNLAKLADRDARGTIHGAGDNR